MSLQEICVFNMEKVLFKANDSLLLVKVWISDQCSAQFLMLANIAKYILLFWVQNVRF